MAEEGKSRMKFRWKRFIVTLIVVSVFVAIGDLTKAPPVVPTDPSADSSAEKLGAGFGIIIVTLIIYGIDSLILRRRERIKAASSQPTSGSRENGAR